MGDFDHIQDVVGQLPFLKTYSHLLLVFKIPDDELSRELIEDRLLAASRRVTEAVPWLAAKVVERSNAEGTSRSFHLEPCERWLPPNSIVSLKDHGDGDGDGVVPSCPELLAARGPASMLSGDVLAPRKAFPESYDETEEDPAPVLALQANFIPGGGLLLDCAAQHNFVDMGGIEQCLNLLAAALRGEELPADAVAQANLDRRSLVPLLEPHEALQDHSQFLRPRPGGAVLPVPSSPLEPSSPFSWRYFRFTPRRLADLRRLASSQEEEEDPGPSPSGSDGSAARRASTNDALTAFCWQRVVAARLRRRGTAAAGAVAKLCRAVDARRAAGVPRAYMGDLVTIATSRMTFGGLAGAPLAEVARVLRRDLEAVSTLGYVRSFATFVARAADRAEIGYGGRFDPDTDVGTSSWAHVGLARVDFGARLGRPALIRRPTFGPLRSDVYLMPQTECGAIDALLCFNEADFDGLMEDALWTEHADYIG